MHNEYIHFFVESTTIITSFRYEFSKIKIQICFKIERFRSDVTSVKLY
jgi:hypothetical protein